ncbi:MAG: methyl-accepting chemotaxis protein [Paraburkholderia sp.]|uniref:methyl-accepting chemotaxis protein n=1 Tax=Paraburkholderia sp. TaxID=1926495 RepID=UPI003C65F20F
MRGNDSSSLVHVIWRTGDALTGTIRQIKDAVDNVANGAHKIAHGNADLSTCAENQAASLKETVASVEEITSMVHRTAENARTATERAVSATEVVERGGETAEQVVFTMCEISAESHKMAEIIAVIEGTAFQANILALNAAVEAARAGDEGRGVAVWRAK